MKKSICHKGGYFLELCKKSTEVFFSPSYCKFPFSPKGDTSNPTIKNTKSAELLISVAFNAINIKSITRSQLVSASKTLKLQLKTSLAKDELLIPVANGLIAAGYVTVRKENGPILTREEIISLRSF